MMRFFIFSAILIQKSIMVFEYESRLDAGLFARYLRKHGKDCVLLTTGTRYVLYSSIGKRTEKTMRRDFGRDYKVYFLSSSGLLFSKVESEYKLTRFNHKYPKSTGGDMPSAVVRKLREEKEIRPGDSITAVKYRIRPWIDKNLRSVNLAEGWLYLSKSNRQSFRAFSLEL